ncbi:MAG TPA: hypothetical protein PLQ76_07075 [bacterium]|nr:hypothetical protein [bacterium]
MNKKSSLGVGLGVGALFLLGYGISRLFVQQKKTGGAAGAASGKNAGGDPNKRPEKVPCPSCGALVREYEFFCQSCGHPMEKAKETAVSGAGAVEK